MQNGRDMFGAGSLGCDRTLRGGPAPTRLLASPSTLQGDLGGTLSEAEPGRDDDDVHIGGLQRGAAIGRFVMLELLGRGGMGEVFLCYDPELDRRVAVKLLRPMRGGRAGEAPARLLREARAIARLSHPNVVTVHDVAVWEGRVFLAMEYVAGPTLTAWAREHAADPAAIVAVYRQAGEGLAAAHAAGLVHRDFKPSNAMIDADGRVRVLDFGLVRAQAGLDVTTVDASSSRHHMALQLTHAGDVVGTPAYMSPEQIRGAEIGPASDQFSLCVALHEALYGQLPFAGDSLGSLFRSIQRHKLPEPPRGSRVPAWVRAALLRGLHPVPEDRFASMDALLRALGASSTRRRRLGLGIGVGAVAVAALAGFLTARAQGPELCTGAAAELAAVWNDGGRDGLGRALSAAGPAFDAELTLAAYFRETYAAKPAWQGL